MTARFLNAKQVQRDMSYIDTLIQNCIAAKAATPSRVIEVDDLSALDGIRKAIYVSLKLRFHRPRSSN